jgi:cell wall-associated NlpC family hydrolase
MDRFEHIVRAVGATAVLLLLGACAGTPSVDDGAAAQRSIERPHIPDTQPHGVRGTVTRVATDMLGVPYRYGGTSPSEGFDCSGLVFYAYTYAGLSVPRNSVELFKAAEKIPLDAAREGDLVFFQDQRKLSHVGIYLGDNRFVHAPSSGSTVRVSTLDSAYYRRHLVGVGRLIGD